MKTYNYNDKQIDAFIHGIEIRECAAKRIKGDEGRCLGCKIVGNGDRCLQAEKTRKSKPLPVIAPEVLSVLTIRENQVYNLSSAGVSETQIAKMLNLSRGRISNIRSQIIAKGRNLGVGKTGGDKHKPVEKYYVA